MRRCSRTKSHSKSYTTGETACLGAGTTTRANVGASASVGVGAGVGSGAGQSARAAAGERTSTAASNGTNAGAETDRSARNLFFQREQTQHCTSLILGIPVGSETTTAGEVFSAALPRHRAHINVRVVSDAGGSGSSSALRLYSMSLNWPRDSRESCTCASVT